jgi:hypothetical protein
MMMCGNTSSIAKVSLAARRVERQAVCSVSAQRCSFYSNFPIRHTLQGKLHATSTNLTPQSWEFKHLLLLLLLLLLLTFT